MNLYPDQETFVAQIRDAFRSHQAVLAQAATGFGKTIVASFIAKAAAAKGKRVYFTVHRKNLITQTQRAFHSMGIPHGVIAAGRSEMLHEPVQIISIQSLARRLERIPPCDLAVIDECHLACSPSWSRVLHHFKSNGARLLGNSATPARLDNKPLGEHFDVIVEGPSVRSLIDAGRLSDYRIFAPSTPDLHDVSTRAGEYVSDELEEVMDTGAITGGAVEHYRRLMPGKRAIAFCVSIAHSRHVADQFIANGIPARHIDGETSHDERQAAIAAFANGSVSVLCNVDLITTGFDLSAQVGREVPVEGAIMLRPTQSTVLWIQMIGRVLRRKPDPAIIADHAGGTMKHGLPCTLREWTLEGRKRRKSTSDETAPALRHCPDCFCVFRAILPACPLCGWIPETKARVPEHVDGELVELDKAQIEKERMWRKQEEKTAASIDGFEGLVRLAVEREYATGWAAHRWAARLRRQGQHVSPNELFRQERELRKAVGV